MTKFKGKAIYQPVGKAAEIWKDIDCFEGIYQVSDLGNIRSFPRNGTAQEVRLLKLNISKKTGYVNVCLCKNNVKVQKRVNRLVAISFIKNPYNLPEVNHKDGNKLNNQVPNLEWCTNSENKKHAYKTGLLSRKGIENCSAKLDAEKVSQIKTLLKSGISQRKIANEYSVSQQTISDINTGKSWSEVSLLKAAGLEHSQLPANCVTRDYNMFCGMTSPIWPATEETIQRLDDRIQGLQEGIRIIKNKV